MSLVLGAAAMGDRWILHFDLDAMFASVEALLDPSLAGKPIIVGARPGTRGVVSTCSYEARAFGVHSALPIGEAQRRCPNAVFLPVRHSVYREYSLRVLAVVSAYADRLQPVSIDEAFVDLSLHADPMAIAHEIKEEIRQRIGLVASMGLAANRLVAKVATDSGKPDGFVVVPHGHEPAFLAPLPIRRLWGVGPKTAQRLELAGIHTIGDLASADWGALRDLLGSNHARELRRHAEGMDDSPVEPDREIKSLSEEITFQQDEGDRRVLWRVLKEQSIQCASRLKSHKMVGRTVTLKLRFSDFHTITRSITLSVPTDDAELLSETAAALMRQWWAPEGRSLRLMGLRVSRLEPTPGSRQLPLLPLLTTI